MPPLATCPAGGGGAPGPEGADAAGAAAASEAFSAASKKRGDFVEVLPETAAVVG